MLLFLAALLTVASAADLDPRIGQPTNCAARPADRPAEVPYNGLDDDCDPDTPDDDLDHDGRLRAEDCDDRALEGAVVVEGPVTWPPEPPCGEQPIVVRGDLVIDTEAKTLHGLSCVCAVTGDLDLTGNQQIPNLEGLDQLTRIGGSLKLVATRGLASTRGLDELSAIGGDLIIEKNKALAYIEGFPELTAVRGSVRITDNPELYSIEGFDKLERIGGDLTIRGNDKLKRIRAMKLLALVGGEVDLSGNDSLESVKGLEEVFDAATLFPERMTPENESAGGLADWLVFPSLFEAVAYGVPALLILTVGLIFAARALFEHEDERLDKAKKVTRERGDGLGEDFFEHLRFDGEDDTDRMWPRALDALDPSLIASASLQVQEFAYGDHLMYADTTDTAALWLVRGDVVVELDGVEIGQAGPEMVLGAIGLFEDVPREVDIRAVEATRALVVSRTAYDAAVTANHPAAIPLERAALATQALLLRALRDHVAAAAIGTRNLPALEPEQNAASRLETWLDQLVPGGAGTGPADPKSLLDQVTAFDALAPAYLAELADQSALELFEPGEILFAQGARDGQMYIVASGTVELLAAYQGQRDMVSIGSLAAGDFFGANSLFTGTPRVCAAVATTRATALVIDPELATELLAMDHDMAHQLRVAWIRALAAARRAALTAFAGGGFVSQTDVGGPPRTTKPR